MASDTRDRSRSPVRPKKSKGGFKWKDKPRKDSDTTEDTTPRSTHRERSPKYDSRRRDEDDRSHDEPREKRRRREDEDGHRSRRDGTDDKAHKKQRNGIDKDHSPASPVAAAAAPQPQQQQALDPKSAAAKFGARASQMTTAPQLGAVRDSTTSTSNTAHGSTSQPPARAAAVAAAATAAPVATATAVNEPMMIVHVNDRLGTKAAIPCLGSDPVGAFKAMVAARIGRRPHEIMLRRQGERPFKDHITLADYGVSSGVQLDLELDTGD